MPMDNTTRNVAILTPHSVVWGQPSEQPHKTWWILFPFPQSAPLLPNNGLSQTYKWWMNWASSCYSLCGFSQPRTFIVSSNVMSWEGKLLWENYYQTIRIGHYFWLGLAKGPAKSIWLPGNGSDEGVMGKGCSTPQLYWDSGISSDLQFSELSEDILRELSAKPAAGAWNAAYPGSPPPAHKHSWSTIEILVPIQDQLECHLKQEVFSGAPSPPLPDVSLSLLHLFIVPLLRHLSLSVMCNGYLCVCLIPPSLL